MALPTGSSQKQRDFLGLSFTALCGGALALNLVLILAILVLIGYQGGRYFWQRDLVELRLSDGRTLLGEVHDREEIPAGVGEGHRIQLKVGNRDLTGADFVWIDESGIRERREPEDAVLLTSFVGGRRNPELPARPDAELAPMVHAQIDASAQGIESGMRARPCAGETVYSA